MSQYQLGYHFTLGKRRQVSLSEGERGEGWVEVSWTAAQSKENSAKPLRGLLPKPANKGDLSFPGMGLLWYPHHTLS